MIQTDSEFEVTRERIHQVQDQLAFLRKAETDPLAFRLSASGFIAELDRMQLEVREYLSTPEIGTVVTS